MECRAPDPVAPARAPWFPRQHGAWAMLAVPLLLGVAATAPSPWHLVLGVAAVAGYLAAATAQAWLRARRRPTFLPSLALYGGVFATAGGLLLVAFPALLLATVVVVPASALVIGGARPGTPRDLVNSLAQTAIALVLAPAAALLSGAWEADTVLRATLVAAGYLVGTVLVVRSVIRQRGRLGFTAFSVAFHAALTVGAAVILPWAYAACAAGLTARAIGLPIVERRRAGTARPLRPVHVGIVEIVASTVLVVIAFVVPL
ncbi:MAG: YwiC-like family protein [Chloroflexota bacterium]